MPTSSFPVHSTTLSAAALAELVARRYAVGPAVKCWFWADSVNETYMVTAGTVRYVLRVYRRGWRTQRDVEAEIELLLYLRKQGVPVSAPVPRRDGAYLNRLVAPEGVRYLVLFTYAPGQVKDLKGKESRAYGQLAGRIHVLTDAFRAACPRFQLDLGHLVDKPLRTVEPFLEARKGDFEYLVETGRQLKEQVCGLLPTTKPEYGICHGDHHGANVHLDPSGQMTLFDFDCFGYGWRAYDVAVFLWSGALNTGPSAKDKAKGRRRWHSFLDGYAAERAMTSSELAATRLFVPIRHIWLLGLHTQGAPNWGHGWLNDGYFDHQIGFIRRWVKNHRLL